MTDQSLEVKCGIEFEGTIWCERFDADCPYMNHAKSLLIKYYGLRLRLNVQTIYRACERKDAPRTD